MKRFLFVLLLFPTLVMAQEAEKESIWEPFKYFVGKWEGTGQGKSGISTITTEFAFVLSDKYLRVTNKAVFEPQEQNPEGEIHEDLGFISYDASRKKFIFRQFHVEGFVNQYVLDTLSANGKRLVFITESVENGPPGLQAKWVLTLVDDLEMHTAFSLAFPGQEFACFSENQLQRHRPKIKINPTNR